MSRLGSFPELGGIGCRGEVYQGLDGAIGHAGEHLSQILADGPCCICPKTRGAKGRECYWLLESQVTAEPIFCENWCRTSILEQFVAWLEVIRTRLCWTIVG
jgi:hypothetical protein